MAQIIQYKDRLLDTSVYPITVAAAVYVMNDSATLNTLDDILDTKVESVVIMDDPSLGDASISDYVSTHVEQDFNTDQRKTALKNLGIYDTIKDFEHYIIDASSLISNKQDKLQHGPQGQGNIKTINGANILGNGNVDIFEYEHSIFVDDELDPESTNPIMNKTVTNSFKNVTESLNKLESDVHDELEKAVKALDASLSETIDNIPITKGTKSHTAILKDSDNIASEEYSMSVGYGVKSSNEYQFSCGKHNSDDDGLLFCVGNGTDDSNRSNAFAVTEQGSIISNDASINKIISNDASIENIISYDASIENITTNRIFSPIVESDRLSASRVYCEDVILPSEISISKSFTNINIIKNFVCIDSVNGVFYSDEMSGNEDYKCIPFVAGTTNFIEINPREIESTNINFILSRYNEEDGRYVPLYDFYDYENIINNTRIIWFSVDGTKLNYSICQLKIDNINESVTFTITKFNKLCPITFNSNEGLTCHELNTLILSKFIGARGSYIREINTSEIQSKSFKWNDMGFATDVVDVTIGVCNTSNADGSPRPDGGSFYDVTSENISQWISVGTYQILNDRNYKYKIYTQFVPTIDNLIVYNDILNYTLTLNSITVTGTFNHLPTGGVRSAEMHIKNIPANSLTFDKGKTNILELMNQDKSQRVELTSETLYVRTDLDPQSFKPTNIKMAFSIKYNGTLPEGYKINFKTENSKIVTLSGDLSVPKA